MGIPYDIFIEHRERAAVGGKGGFIPKWSWDKGWDFEVKAAPLREDGERDRRFNPIEVCQLKLLKHSIQLRFWSQRTGSPKYTEISKYETARHRRECLLRFKESLGGGLEQARLLSVAVRTQALALEVLER